MGVAIRHGRIVVDPKPVFDPLGGVPRHMVQAIGASSFLPAVNGRDDGNLVNVILPEHRERRRGRSLPPRKQIAVVPAGGFFPLGFRREPLIACATKVRGLQTR